MLLKFEGAGAGFGLCPNPIPMPRPEEGTAMGLLVGMVPTCPERGGVEKKGFLVTPTSGPEVVILGTVTLLCGVETPNGD
jgi:hypothetical protein